MKGGAAWGPTASPDRLLLGGTSKKRFHDINLTNLPWESGKASKTSVPPKEVGGRTDGGSP